MVRLKNRYLLLEILYPEPSTWPAATSTSTSTSTKRSPHERDSHLRIHAPTADSLSPGGLARLVRDEVAELFGDWGVGRLGGVGGGGVSVKYLSAATSTAIIRCPRASFRLVWAALTYLSRVPGSGSASASRPGGGGGGGGGGRECVFRVVRVSGTMRKAEEEAIARARREIVRVRGAEEEGVLGGLVGMGEDPVVNEKMEEEEEEEDVGMGDSEED